MERLRLGDSVHSSQSFSRKTQPHWVQKIKHFLMTQASCKDQCRWPRKDHQYKRKRRIKQPVTWRQQVSSHKSSWNHPSLTPKLLNWYTVKNRPKPTRMQANQVLPKTRQRSKSCKTRLPYCKLTLTR